MKAVTPRWEWRAFARRFLTAEDVFAGLAHDPAVESEELYLLSDGDANVKVRDDLMDIKVLREVDDAGLERWEPIMKEPFPLTGDAAARVFDARGVAPPALSGDPYPLDRFLDELVRPHDAVRAVRVAKRRTRYSLAGCMAEMTEVRAEGRSTTTVAIESERAHDVVEAVRQAGLDGYRNTSYPKGLRALIGDEPERYAAIDIGTNSVKFAIAEIDDAGASRRVVDRAEVTRLGQDRGADGRIADEPLERTATAIVDMVEEARRQGCRAIVAVGTAAIRSAVNRDDVVAAIRARAGVTVEVLSGEEESRLGFLAVTSGLGVTEGSLAVFDTGGGSTEFTFGDDGQIDERFSLDVGAASYTERFGLDGAVDLDALRDARAAIAGDLARIDGRPTPDTLVGMGGAVTNMVAVQHALTTYDPDVVQGATLQRTEVERQIEVYRSKNDEDRRSITGLQPNRAGVILAGACIVASVMEQLRKDSLTASDRGLRHGLLAERFGA
jgi:exopolyphosphatase / guanosine-5'-triphosphate,3'-diphosphate pyrophosphatase